MNSCFCIRFELIHSVVIESPEAKSGINSNLIKIPINNHRQVLEKLDLRPSGLTEKTPQKLIMRFLR